MVGDSLRGQRLDKIRLGNFAISSLGVQSARFVFLSSSIYDPQYLLRRPIICQRVAVSGQNVAGTNPLRALGGFYYQPFIFHPCLAQLIPPIRDSVGEFRHRDPVRLNLLILAFVQKGS
nr:Os04g0404601 [Ipomoea batatas]